MSLFKKIASGGTKKSEHPGGPGKSIKGRKYIKWVVIVIVIIIAVMTVRNFINGRRNYNTAAITTENVKVETRDIQKVLSSSGTVAPLSTYEVRTLVEGEILAADFEEGDQVEESDILYQITTDDLDSKIDSAKTSVTRASDDYNKAVESYEKAAEDYQEALDDYNKAKEDEGNPNVTADVAGTITVLSAEVGDTIQAGTQIANVYDNSSMLLEVPFLSSEVDSILVGEEAEVELTDSFEVLVGTVTKVSSLEQVLSGNRLVKMVTIKVENPGGLTSSNTATASIGSLYSSSDGTFKPLEDTVILAGKSGEITRLNIEEGSKIKVGDILFVLSEDSVESSLDNYEKNLDSADSALDNATSQMENAKEAIEDAESSLQDQIDMKTDYSVTAPISGQVIRKDVLVGDTISSNSSLCVIYDLSALTFEMYIDELDVLSVKVGQEVDITADALEGVEISGVVTNISLESTSNNGVTQYPVTVRIDETGDLLPGMNVTGEIIIEKVEGVLAVPADALMRGDLVYVADESVTEAVGDVPAGYRSVEVETGLSDGDYIEIKSGLNGDEEVYVVRATGTTETIMMPGQFNQEMPNGQTRPSGSVFGGGGGTRPQSQ
jgi:HlyD family secretion protein